MLTTPITGTPSEVLVEQLVASGIKYVFYNSGSREALFFDALNNNHCLLYTSQSQRDQRGTRMPSYD